MNKQKNKQINKDLFLAFVEQNVEQRSGMENGSPQWEVRAGFSETLNSGRGFVFGRLLNKPSICWTKWACWTNLFKSNKRTNMFNKFVFVQPKNKSVQQIVQHITRKNKYICWTNEQMNRFVEQKVSVCWTNPKTLLSRICFAFLFMIAPPCPRTLNYKSNSRALNRGRVRIDDLALP